MRRKKKKRKGERIQGSYGELCTTSFRKAFQVIVTGLQHHRETKSSALYSQFTDAVTQVMISQ